MSFGSLLLAVSFVFGNAAKNLFEGVLFLFSQHPFDVGMNFPFLSLLTTDKKDSNMYNNQGIVFMSAKKIILCGRWVSLRRPLNAPTDN